jgi:hypothetical protein
MNTKDKVFVLLEEFKNELKTRLDTIYDLRQVRIATYSDFQERYDTWYCDEIEEAYANWRERQDKSLAKKIAETGNEYTIEGYRWKVSFPGDRRSDTWGELVDGLGHELFPAFGDDFKLSDMAILQQWSNLVKIYVSKTGDRDLTGLVEVLEIAISELTSTIDVRISKLRDAVVIAEYEQANLEEKCKKAMRPHYKKYHDELRRVMQELYDAGKHEFVETMSNYMIWEDFNIWYKDATEHKRELDEVVKYLDLAKKVL